MQAGACALEFFKQQFEGLHLTRDTGDASTIDGLSGLGFGAAEDVEEMVHVGRFQKAACGGDLARLGAHPHGLGKLKELLHLGLGRSVEEFEILIHGGLDVQVAIPTEFAVQIEHEVADPRPGHDGHVRGFRVDSARGPADLRREAKGMVIEPVKALFHVRWKNDRDRREVVVRGVLQVVFPDEELLRAIHGGDPFFAIGRFVSPLRQAPVSAGLGEADHDIVRHLFQLRGDFSSGPVGKDGELFVRILSLEAVTDGHVEIPRIITVAPGLPAFLELVPTCGVVIAIDQTPAIRLPDANVADAGEMFVHLLEIRSGVIAQALAAEAWSLIIDPAFYPAIILLRLLLGLDLDGTTHAVINRNKAI